MARIDVLCRDGSPLGVSLDDIYGQNGRVGVGGAESSLLTLCEAWHNDGHAVVLYNNPTHKGSPFEQRNVGEFSPTAERDFLIIFRSPNPAAIGAKGKKIWFSCDQYTIDNFKEFSQHVDQIVTISRFHSDYFKNIYGILDTKTIDLPVRGWDYNQHKNSIHKIPKQCLFSSVPDRGLPILAATWPRIVEQVPDASLVITSGWSLWTGTSDAQYLSSYRLMFANLKNVQYVGAVPRAELVRHQLQSELLTYPCVYDELFCISVAESQWAGAWPITSNIGALSTTNMGTVIVGNPSDFEWQNAFVEQVVQKLNAPNLSLLQNNISWRARERFNIRRITNQWETDVFCS